MTTQSIQVRDGKSFKSIVEKLVRQRTLRLSQIQDIEGCRIVVDSRIEQDALTYRLLATLEKSKMEDRRLKPSSGYRAIHVIARIEDASFEIQIRTLLQHAWAQLVEALASRDQSIKYGGGGPELQHVLDGLSTTIDDIERVEEHMFQAFLGSDLLLQDEHKLAEVEVVFKKMMPEAFADDPSATWTELYDRYDEEKFGKYLSKIILQTKTELYGSVLKAMMRDEP